MLKLLDQAFFLFHSLLIAFNMFGWIAPRTRSLHRIVLGLTAFSWFGLGAFYGWGYCLCTDWHFQVRRQLGHVDPESSYIQLLIDRAIGVSLSRPASDFLAMSIFLGIVVATVIVGVRDRRRANRGEGPPRLDPTRAT